MEAKINIATILKDKPEGTKLWTDMFGSVTLYVVTDACDSFQVKHHNKEPWFDKEGKLCKEGVLCIYPSKSMRDWEKFAWKKGDVLISNDGKVKVIFEKFRNDTYLSFIGKHHLDSIECNNPYYQHEGEYATGSFKLEEVDTAQTYINTIEERLGGKLNRETLEVEKAQPEFNDGDIAFADYGNRQEVFIVSDKTNLSEGYDSFISLDLRGTLSMGYRTSFFKKDLCKLRLATEEEKQQLFEALAKEGKAWDREKKVIVDLKPKVELKPFDKVLIRDDEDHPWRVSLFGYKDANSYYCCNGCTWNQCIPYEGNEHLLGTTKDVEG